jgi:heme-degrading monooxygenase HmoA
MTVLTFERYPVAPDRLEEFERAVAGLLAGIRAAPGALWAEGLRALDGAGGYAVAAEWRTDADADAWASSDAAGAFATEADVLLGAEVTRRRFVSAG